MDDAGPAVCPITGTNNVRMRNRRPRAMKKVKVKEERTPRAKVRVKAAKREKEREKARIQSRKRNRRNETEAGPFLMKIRAG